MLPGLLALHGCEELVPRDTSSLLIPRLQHSITRLFQILWVYYGLLIAPRPVIVWNMLAMIINFVSVAAYYHFLKHERAAQGA